MKKWLWLLRRQSFGIAVLVCAAIAFAFPAAFDSWGGVKLTTLVMPALQLIMFGMGTTLAFSDFMRVATRPLPVALGVFLQFIIMPLVGLALAKVLGFTGELAAGCILVGSVAGGTASNVVAFLAKADVALSVTMTCCSTLLSPFVTPLAMKLLAGRFVEIDTMKMMVGILKVVVVPVIAGAVVHTVLRKQFETHKALLDRILSIISMAGICFIIMVISAPSRATFASAGALIIVAAILHNVIGYLSGYWLTRLAGRFAKLGESEARTVAIEVGMQNSGMASALAVGVLDSPIAALPANVFSVWMDFSGSVLASYFASKPIGKRAAGAS